MDVCTRDATRRTWCDTHYLRWLTKGDVLAHIPIQRGGWNKDGEPCSVDACQRIRYAHSFCRAHYARWKRLGDPGSSEIRRQGSWHLTKDGYRIVYVDGRVRREHRFVVEQMLGRALLQHESVHHKNGVKHDNRLDNLELWSSSHPPGQRVQDKVAWAKEILALYGED